MHIKKLQNRAILSLSAILLTIISLGFGILSLSVSSFAAVFFFILTILGIVYLICSSRNAKKEAIRKPVVFHSNKILSWEELVDVFGNLTAKNNHLLTSEDVQFFRLEHIFHLRTVLYRTACFNKKDFDNAKDRMNKKANSELNLPYGVSRMESGKMMRFYIIFTDTVNDALYQFLSKNASQNLTRVEGIINIAIVGNQIIIPPLYGECDLAEVSRYKGVVKFVNQVLLRW